MLLLLLMLSSDGDFLLARIFRHHDFFFFSAEFIGIQLNDAYLIVIHTSKREKRGGKRKRGREDIKER
jgi:hypothetical protein